MNYAQKVKAELEQRLARDREIIKLHREKRISMKDLAALYGITRERVRQIIHRGI